MPTVATVIARQPWEYQQRYDTTYWVNWINELLEALSGEGLLMPDTNFETGVRVTQEIWVAKPSGLRTIGKIYNPANPDMEYRFKEIENKIKLLDVEVTEDSSPDTATAFSDYAVGSIKANIADATEDEYEDFLLVVTAGTETGRTIIISGNDASVTGYTKLYFRHDLASALSATKITACSLLPDTSYIIMEYSGSYEDVADASSEIPIEDHYERRITNAWLRWKIEQQISALSDNSLYYEKQYQKILDKIKIERRSNVGRIQPREIPGLTQYQDESCEDVKYQKELYE